MVVRSWVIPVCWGLSSRTLSAKLVQSWPPYEERACLKSQVDFGPSRPICEESSNIRVEGILRGWPRRQTF